MEQDFSFDNFRKWLKKQKTNEDVAPKRHKDHVLGMTVESKISPRKLAAVMEVEQGDPADLAIDFKENNGIIADVRGRDFLIEVDSGSFLIARHYVREIAS